MSCCRCFCEEIDYQILHKTLFVVGVPESVLADKIEPFEEEFPGSIKLAVLATTGDGATAPDFAREAFGRPYGRY